jgi:predicted nucleic acid-binding protein
VLIAEVANVAWKKILRGEIDRRDGRIMVEDSADGTIDLVPSQDLRHAALGAAVALQHPIYDCFYLACADFHAGPLVTADRRLLAAVRNGPYEGLVRHVAEA